MQATSRRVVSISEAADYCQVTAETIRRWVDHGEIPSTRTLGGHRRINLKDFQEFLRKRNIGKFKAPEASGTRTLIVGSNEPICAKLQKTIREAAPETETTHVQTSFEAGQKIALDEPDFVFFVGGMEGLEVPAAVQAIRENIRTRMVRVIFVGHPDTPSRKTGADFTILDAGDKDLIKGIYTHSEI